MSRQQVATIAVRRRGDDREICLIRRKDSFRWSIPKGFIDPGDTPEEAALAEAFEEAGVRGRILGDAIGTYRYEKRTATLTVELFVMEVTEEHPIWLEARFRERRWVLFDDAVKLLADHPVRDLLRLAKSACSVES